MAKNMLPPAAAASEDNREITFQKIIFIAVPLSFLMMSGLDDEVSCILAICAAGILAIMSLEDAFEQTIDVRFLFLLMVTFFCLACMQDRYYDFFIEWVMGTFIFQSFRLLLSVWMTWRAGEDAQESGERTAKTESPAIGYVPIFLLVFVMYLGFGTAWASPVFNASAEFISIIKELAGVFPQAMNLCFMVFFLLIFFLDNWVAGYSHRKPFLWAFGGGDVLFLGLFAGYLGMELLLALYFLSLVAQLLLFNVPHFLKRGRDAS